MTMSIDKIVLNQILQGIKVGTAPNLPEDAWFPEREQTLEEARRLQEHKYAQDQGIELSIEDISDPLTTLSPEQAAYTVALCTALEISDQFKLLKRMTDQKDREDQKVLIEKTADNSLRWFMDNVPPLYVMYFARMVFAHYKVTMDPSRMPNWDEFSSRYMPYFRPDLVEEE